MHLIEFSRIGSLKTIEEVIETKGLPNDNKWQDYEALNAALQFGHKEVAKYLLGKNCRVNKYPLSPAETRSTPLHYAVLLRDAELVDLLLEKRASVLAVNSDGDTPLHQAFVREYYEIVDRIFGKIQETSEYKNVANKYGLTHMHIACTRNNEDIIRKYLKNESDINDKVSDESLQWAGYDAMKFATNFQSSIAREILLEVGDKQTKTPTGPVDSDDYIESAVMNAEVCKIMDDFYGENCYEKMWDFHNACLAKNNTAVIGKFIKYETSINTHIRSNDQDYPGYTPLHFAVESGSVENVRLLLRHGAKVDRINWAQMTPLHLALYNEDPDNKSTIVDVLYKAVKDKYETFEDENLLSFFHVAITRNKLRFVEEFLYDDQDVNQRLMLKTPNFPGYTPIHFAVRYRLLNMVKYLIRQGANMNKVSGHGTPLDIAYMVKDADLIALLRANRVGA